MVYQCIIDIGKSGVVPQCSKFVTISWPNLQKNIILNRHLVKLANSKCTALPENYHRQPHSSFYSTGSSSKSPLGLSDPLEACICLQRWACGDLLGQPFLHLEEFCFKRLISFTFWFKAGFIFSKSLVEEVDQTKLPQNEEMLLFQIRRVLKSHFLNYYRVCPDYRINAKGI